VSAKRRSSLDALFDVADEAMEMARTTGPAGAPASGQQMLSIRSIRPDPLQARRILPPAVRAGFVAGQLDAPGALAGWRALADDDPRERELLQSQIVALALSIRQQELVNPITVLADGLGGYILETGERRWWAHWWLFSVENEPAYEQIRAQVIMHASPERQAAENLQDSPLTAVQEACQVARLLLHLTGQDTDHVVAILAGEGDAPDLVGYDLYRRALEMERGEVYGKWRAVSEVMARGERQLMRQLSILRLGDEPLNVADRAQLTEGQLRPLVSAAAETSADRQWQIVDLTARYNLPGGEVERLVKNPDLADAEARIRRDQGLDQEERSKPTAIRRPSAIMVDRIRSLRRLVARHEKGGLQISDLVAEIRAADQADAIRRDLEELAELLALVRQQLDFPDD